MSCKSNADGGNSSSAHVNTAVDIQRISAEICSMKITLFG